MLDYNSGLIVPEIKPLPLTFHKKLIFNLNLKKIKNDNNLAQTFLQS